MHRISHRGVLLVTVALLPAAAFGQSQPPGWVGQVMPRGGLADSDARGQTGAGLLDGAYTQPLGAGFTAKGEAQGSAFGGDTGTGGRLHLWWQDPALALLGVSAESARRDGLTQNRFIGKGEYYLGPFTLRGQGGYVLGDKDANGEIKAGLFGLAAGGWYPRDALGLNLGASAQDGRGVGFANVEWAPGFMPRGTSFTLDGASGANGYRMALVGIRFTFGPGAGGSVRDRQVGEAPGFPAFDVGIFQKPPVQAPEQRGSGQFP